MSSSFKKLKNIGNKKQGTTTYQPVPNGTNNIINTGIQDRSTGSKAQSLSPHLITLLPSETSRALLLNTKPSPTVNQLNSVLFSCLRASFEEKGLLQTGSYVCDGGSLEFLVKRIDKIDPDIGGVDSILNGRNNVILRWREYREFFETEEDKQKNGGNNNQQQQSSSSSESQSQSQSQSSQSQSQNPKPESHSCRLLRLQQSFAQLKIDLQSKPFPVWDKIHCLPYMDSFTYNFDHMFTHKLVPFFKGTPVPFVGYMQEFSFNGGRFRVEAVIKKKAPAIGNSNTVGNSMNLSSRSSSGNELQIKTSAENESNSLDFSSFTGFLNSASIFSGYSQPTAKQPPEQSLCTDTRLKCVVGYHTDIRYEGPQLERSILNLLHVLPFEDTLPQRYKTNKSRFGKYAPRMDVNEQLLLKEILEPYFEQRSRDFKVGGIFCPGLERDLAGGYYDSFGSTVLDTTKMTDGRINAMPYIEEVSPVGGSRIRSRSPQPETQSSNFNTSLGTPRNQGNNNNNFNSLSQPLMGSQGFELQPVNHNQREAITQDPMYGADGVVFRVIVSEGGRDGIGGVSLKKTVLKCSGTSVRQAVPETMMKKLWEEKLVFRDLNNQTSNNIEVPGGPGGATVTGNSNSVNSNSPANNTASASASSTTSNTKVKSQAQLNVAARVAAAKAKAEARKQNQTGNQQQVIQYPQQTQNQQNLNQTQSQAQGQPQSLPTSSSSIQRPGSAGTNRRTTTGSGNNANRNRQNGGTNSTNSNNKDLDCCCM